MEEKATSPNEMKSAFEIGAMASRLSPKNQAYVLNTINALLFAQQTVKESGEDAGR